MLNPDIIEAKIPKYADVLKKRYGQERWRQVLEKTAEMMLDLGNGCGLSPDDFSRITSKVLISRGSEDTMVSGEESKNVVTLLKSASYKEFVGFPHLLEMIDLDVLESEFYQFF